MKNTLMLATVWDEDRDPTGWWITEKFDGIRLFWNGRSLKTRQGNAVPAPENWISQMPSTPLDGELWCLTIYYI